MARDSRPLLAFIEQQGSAGATSPQVAEFLGLSPLSAKKHLQRLRRQGITVRIGDGGPWVRWATPATAEAVRQQVATKTYKPRKPRKKAPPKRSDVAPRTFPKPTVPNSIFDFGDRLAVEQTPVTAGNRG